jgi:hypothetical protein
LQEVGLCGPDVDSRPGGGHWGRGGGLEETPSAEKDRQASLPFPQVWREKDFDYLKQKLSLRYPAAHYFKR